MFIPKELSLTNLKGFMGIGFSNHRFMEAIIKYREYNITFSVLGDIVNYAN